MLNVGSEKIARWLPNNLITTQGSGKVRNLYLTFDDGPHPQYTLSVCELLEKFDARASFFCIGQNIQRYPEIAREITKRGHFLANHSQTHRSFRSQSLKSQLAEVDECQNRICELFPGSHKVFRAPQGHLSPRLLLSLRQRGWKIVHWSFDSLDYRQRSLEAQLAVFNSHPVVAGDILLFHDDNQLAIDILEIQLQKWTVQGFSFPTIKELV